MKDGKPTAVIALGRCDHGDDAAALVVADALRRRLPGHVTLVAAPSTRTGVRDVWRQHARVFVVDTIRAGSTPGTVRRIDPDTDEVPAPHRRGPRDINLADVVVVARTDDHHVELLEIFGIEGKWFTPQAGVSPEAAAAAHDLAERILDEVSA